MNTNTANGTKSESPLLPDEQAWLDATPAHEARTITKCGLSFTVDRRITLGSAPVVVPSFTVGDGSVVGEHGNVTFTPAAPDLVSPIADFTVTTPFSAEDVRRSVQAIWAQSSKLLGLERSQLVV